jgi:hypothetical protein
MYNIEKITELQKELPHLFLSARNRFDSMTYRFTDIPAAKDGTSYPNAYVEISFDRQERMKDVTAGIRRGDAGIYSVYPLLRHGVIDTELAPTRTLLDEFVESAVKAQDKKRETAMDDFEALGYSLAEQLAKYPSALREDGRGLETAAEEDGWDYEDDGPELD